MTKSELIEAIARKQKHLPAKDVELAVKHLLDLMSDSLARGERIEIRGFGSFSLHFRPPRIGRNPKTGEAVALSGKYVPHFKPGAGSGYQNRAKAIHSHTTRAASGRCGASECLERPA
jgi:integration host factor subunit beta